MADTVVVNAGGPGSDDFPRKCCGESLVWTSSTVGYFFYVDSSNDLKYIKSTDAGLTFGSAVNVKTGTIGCFAIWFDKWTPSLTGTKIYCAYTDTTANDFLYRGLETSTDTLDTEQIISNATDLRGSGGTMAQRSCSITKAVGGNLYATFIDDLTAVESGFFRSTDDGATWGARTNLTTVTPAAGDRMRLFPGNAADNQDVWMLFFDASASDLLFATHDDSANTTTSTAINTSIAISGALHDMGFSGAVRHSDGHLFAVAWTAVDSASGDFLAYQINGSASITQRTNVVTDQDDTFGGGCYFDQQTGSLTVFYYGTSSEVYNSAVHVRYRTSTDGAVSWGRQWRIDVDTTRDTRYVTGGMSVGSSNAGPFRPIWIADASAYSNVAPLSAMFDRPPIQCTDINPYVNASGVASDTNEVKAGVTDWLRTEGYPGAPAKYSGIGEVIESGAPQPTLTSRIGGSTPLALDYDPAAGAGGPATLWTAGGAGENNENVTTAIWPRRDAAGWVVFNHRGNNGNPRQGVGKYNTSYDFQTGWTELGSPPLIDVGSGGTWDDANVPDLNGWTWIGNKLVGFYRGHDGSITQVGRVDATWDGAVGSFPGLTKYGSNPVITSSAAPWITTNNGCVPGSIWIDPAGRWWMYLSCNSPNAAGLSYSDDLGFTWVVGQYATITPVSPQTSCGDGVAICIDDTPHRAYGASFVWIDSGSQGAATLEGRYLYFLPFEKTAAQITKKGKSYFPNGSPYSGAALASGGVQGTNSFALAGRFRVPRCVRTSDLHTIYQQGVDGSDVMVYVRIGSTGLLTAFWSTTTTAAAGPPFDKTLTGASAVDDAEWWDFCFARFGANDFRLYTRRAGGAWVLDATNTAEDGGTTSSTQNAAIGNGFPTNGFGNSPCRGVISDLVFMTGAPPDTSLTATGAAFAGMLHSSRTAYSGGTFQWDESNAQWVDNGDVVLVEAIDSTDLPTISTDGSTGTSDHTASGVLFLPASSERGRIVWLDVEFKNVSTGVTAITFDGVTMTLAHSRTVSTAGVATYYLLSDSLPATAGPYTWSVTVDGASGQVNAACSYKPGMLQGGPFATGGADNTSTSISATLNAPSNGWIRDVLYNVTGTDDATPHPTQTETADFSTDSANAGRIATSMRQSWVQASFDMSWTSITTAEQHILIATSWQVEEPPVLALQQPMVPANRAA
jgi:hypothetical protein